MPNNTFEMYRNFYKRIIDFILSLIGLVILSPIFLFVIIGLQLSNKRDGVFFVQERPGKKGKIFKVVKFKTMSDRLDDNGKLLPDALRLTKIGKFIRSTSIDEIPQLINVLKGDMSLVGPRPLLVKYLSLYSSHQAIRHNVRPGITGWAQVNGRNSISWSEKFELDVWYVENISLVLDIRILLKTILNVFLRKGINANSHATMEAFSGND